MAGRPWSRPPGRSIATATGDLLFSRAFAELAGGGSVEPVRVLSDASSALVQGELLQREDAWKLQTTRERYLRRCDLKTARLFRAACELGALAGGGNVALLGEFGERIGLAFQILDDVLDVSGPAERTGKHRGTDLLDGTVTLPLILARERDPELARLDLRAVRTPEQAEGVCDAIAATGALEAAREVALAMVADAKADLPCLPEPSQQAALELVADSVVDRYSSRPPVRTGVSQDLPARYVRTSGARSLRAGSRWRPGRRRSARLRPPCSPARAGAGP